jgi:hypothetical protein
MAKGVALGSEVFPSLSRSCLSKAMDRRDHAFGRFVFFCSPAKKFRAGVARDSLATLGPTPGGWGAT